MKVLILAGGFGTRLSEETDLRPKPMVEIGGRPILWHIMKTYSHYGYNEFVILLGYKGYYIKEYFANYFLHQSDVTIDLKSNNIEIHNTSSEPWKVTLLDTGLDSMTGARIRRAKDYVGEQFMLTYGDGVADIDINELVSFHNTHEGALTMTSSQPEGRFGALDITEDKQVKTFLEKPKGDGNWINAGYFVCDKKVIDYIADNPNTVFEEEPLQNLAKDGEIYTHQHHGFWQPMDTLRDKSHLNSIWNKGDAPWKKWN